MKKRDIFFLALLETLPLVSCANENIPAANSNNKIASCDDAMLVPELKDRFKAEPILKHCLIQIKSKNGHVVLSGLTDSKLQAEKIIILTQMNRWVKSVDATDLKVKNSKIPLTDTYITAKVKALLMRYDLLDIGSPRAITVETKNKVVYLSGTVQEQSQLDRIIDAAKSVKDVQEVRSSLKVAPLN